MRKITAIFIIQIECSTYIDEVVYGWSGVCSIFSFDGKNAYYNKKRYGLKSISDDR
jgi:hypothetical protein